MAFDITGSHQLHLRPHVPSTYPPHPSPAQHHPAGWYRSDVTARYLLFIGTLGLRPLDLGISHIPANGFQVNQAFAAHQVGKNLNSPLNPLPYQQQHLSQDSELVEGGEGGGASPPSSPHTTPLPSPPPLRQVRRSGFKY